MKTKDLLAEGKGKKVWSTEDNDKVVIEFKDEASAFNGKKKGKIKNKGIINNDISEYLFNYLENYYVPTHFIKKISERQMLCKKLDIIPMEIVMRNVAAGSLCTRYNIEEGKVLDTPIMELYLKNDKLGDPLMNEYHAYAFDIVTPEEIRTIVRLSTKINAVLKSFFTRRNLKLVDFKLEFGRYNKQVVLADEISPDSCRVWDISSNEKLDKDRFRFDMGKVEEAYEEVKKRIFSQ